MYIGKGRVQYEAKFGSNDVHGDIGRGVAGCSTGANSGNSTMAPKTDTPKQEAPKAEPAKTDPAAKVKIRVAWWGSQDRNDKTLKAIDLFMKKIRILRCNPNLSGLTITGIK